eukprot:9419939-Prorocentrum_lima.AAC.1
MVLRWQPRFLQALMGNELVCLRRDGQILDCLARSAALHKQMMNRKLLMEPETVVDLFLSFLQPHF